MIGECVCVPLPPPPPPLATLPLLLLLLLLLLPLLLHLYVSPDQSPVPQREKPAHADLARPTWHEKMDK